MNWEGLIALVYGLLFLWSSGNAFFQGRIGRKHLGPGRTTRTSNPAKYWAVVIGFFMASIICLFWAYARSRYGGWLGILSLTSFFPLRL
jgi:hypothetical protein